MTESNPETKRGEKYLFIEIVLWAFFPIVTTLTYAHLPSLISLGWSTLFAAIFFGGVVLYRKSWREMQNLLLWKYIAGIVLFTGVLFYVFYFVGLKYTTPGNAALIALFEVFTSFVFFNILRGEYMSRDHKIGAVLMVIGALIVLAPNFSGINIGDFLVLGATFCAPFGNFFQQKARAIASSEIIVFVRSVVAAAVIFLLAYLFGQHASIGNVQASLSLLLINGVLILGLSKILWIEAIYRMSVTKAIALNSMTPLLTLIIAWAVLSQAPNMWQLASLVPLLLGAFFLTGQLKLPRL